MAYIKKLFHLYTTLKDFEEHRDSNMIAPDSICFIVETLQIYTQGTLFGISNKEFNELKTVVSTISSMINGNPESEDIDALDKVLKFIEGYKTGDSLKEVLDRIQSVLSGVGDINIGEQINDLNLKLAVVEANINGINQSVQTAVTEVNNTKTEIKNLKSSLEFINNSIGAAGGIAPLDSTGKIPSENLPSYVDDVIEFATKEDFPSEGEKGKIYIASDTGFTYRWAETQYAQVSSEDIATIKSEVKNIKSTIDEKLLPSTIEVKHLRGELEVIPKALKDVVWPYQAYSLNINPSFPVYNDYIMFVGTYSEEEPTASIKNAFDKTGVYIEGDDNSTIYITPPYESYPVELPTAITDDKPVMWDVINYKCVNICDLPDGFYPIAAFNDESFEGLFQYYKQQLLNEDGTPVYKTDENGNPVMSDEDGMPIIVELKEICCERHWLNTGGSTILMGTSSGEDVAIFNHSWVLKVGDSYISQNYTPTDSVMKGLNGVYSYNEETLNEIYGVNNINEAREQVYSNMSFSIVTLKDKVNRLLEEPYFLVPDLMESQTLEDATNGYYYETLTLASNEVTSNYTVQFKHNAIYVTQIKDQYGHKFPITPIAVNINPQEYMVYGSSGPFKIKVDLENPIPFEFSEHYEGEYYPVTIEPQSKLRILTKAEYDDIDNKDDNTLYVTP